MLIIKKIILRIIIVNEEIKECYIPVFQFLKDLGITNKECNDFKEMLKNGYNLEYLSWERSIDDSYFVVCKFVKDITIVEKYYLIEKDGNN